MEDEGGENEGEFFLLVWKVALEPRWYQTLLSTRITRGRR